MAERSRSGGMRPGGAPLVSCVMPTYDRRRFVPRALEYFRRQDYPSRELLVLDDGTDRVEDLIPDDSMIRYVPLEGKRSLGAKLNLGCELARGEVVAHWDDDDWYAPRRLGYQVDALLREGTDVCGINHLLYWDLERQRAYEYRYPPDQRIWLIGSSLTYRKSLWEEIRFQDIDVGMDGLFVWATEASRISVLEDYTFAVHTIHGANVSPKRTEGPWWSPYPVESIRTVLREDWRFYASDSDPRGDEGRDSGPVRVRAAPVEPVERPGADPSPVRNVYACLVHENPACVVDLVRNLRHLDPTSTVLLYNGGPDPELLDAEFPFHRWDVAVHPSPRRLAWGRLHDYALDCMRFSLEEIPFDTLTVVDSDQLATQGDFSRRLRSFLGGHPRVGLMGNSAGPQPPDTRVGPAVAAVQEKERWRSFLARFPDGEELFPHWTFWPSTVFTADAARELVDLFDNDEQLQRLVAGTAIWATEEILFPTLTALLGFEVAQSPSSYDYVRYRVAYSPGDVSRALEREDVFFIHPVPRAYDDPIRSRIRDHLDHYPVPAPGTLRPARAAAPEVPDLLLPEEVLTEMSEVEGWLSREEGDLLLAAARHVLDALTPPHALVEIGSYCGRATTVLGRAAHHADPEARVYAVDRFDGRLGGWDVGIQRFPPSLEKFTRRIRQAGLQGVVETVKSAPHQVPWNRPLSLLLVDGLHDYVNVARDFHHFEPFLRDGALVAFHDYADYFPGVRTFVDELLRSGRYTEVRRAGTLIVLGPTGDTPDGSPGH